MKNVSKIISVVILLFAIVVCSGCSRKDFYPSSDIQITKVDPFDIIPSNNIFSSIPDGVISIELLNSVPCELISYDIHYRSSINEPIDSLTISDVFINYPLAESGSEISVTIKPYSEQLLNLFNSSTSNISPVRAIVTLHFRDVNKNEITKEAGFLLYKYESASSSE